MIPMKAIGIEKLAGLSYSAPSIVLQSRGPDGSVHVFDDFRESYAWLRQYTAEDAKVSSFFETLNVAAILVYRRLPVSQTQGRI